MQETEIFCDLLQEIYADFGFTKENIKSPYRLTNYIVKDKNKKTILSTNDMIEYKNFMKTHTKIEVKLYEEPEQEHSCELH